MSYLVPIYAIKTNCIGCGCKVGSKSQHNIKKAHSVGLEQTVQIWLNQKVIVNYKDHKLCSKCFSIKGMQIPSKKTSEPNLELLIHTLTSFCSKSRNLETKNEDTNGEQIQQFLFTNLTIEQCIETCGLAPKSLEEISSLINQNPQIIFEFFYICKQGISQHFASVLANKNQSTISRNFNSVLDNLTTYFVPKWLGASAFSREDVINKHTPKLFKQLHPRVCGGIDGTYFYCEKSSVFDSQRKTYNSHKGRNLIKEMGVILPDGRIFDFLGPFYSDGDHNDEWMWLYIFRT